MTDLVLGKIISRLAEDGATRLYPNLQSSYLEMKDRQGELVKYIPSHGAQRFERRPDGTLVHRSIDVIEDQSPRSFTMSGSKVYTWLTQQLKAVLPVNGGSEAFIGVRRGTNLLADPALINGESAQNIIGAMTVFLDLKEGRARERRKGSVRKRSKQETRMYNMILKQTRSGGGWVKKR